MRRLIFLLVLFVGYIAHAGTLTHNVSFESSLFRYDTIVTNNTQYVRINCDGLDYLSEPGEPELPTKYVRLVVPYNATNLSVSCTYDTNIDTVLTYKILPVEQLQIADENATDTPILIEDSLIYNRNSFYPASLGDIVSDGYFMGENHVITLALHPVRYNPITSVAEFYSNLNATISYDIDPNCANILMRNNFKAREEDQKMLACLIENPHQISSFAPQQYNSNHAPSVVEDSINLLGYEYNIITTKALEPAFKRLVSLKRQKGYSAGTVCVEDIMRNPLVNGGDVMRDKLGNVVSVLADSAGIIREYLKYIYNGQTRYVLLAGRQVPFRCARYIKTDTISIPTDWYFSDFNTNWADNESLHVFSSTDSRIDKNVELYVGRLMFDSIPEVENYTSKLVIYELNPGNDDNLYLKNALVVEGADGFDAKNTVASTYSSIGMNVQNIIQDSGTNYPTGEFVVSQMKYNGIISLHGHGSPHSVSVNNHMINSKENMSYQVVKSLDSYNIPSLNDSNNGLDLMNNKYKPGVFFSWSCDQIPFDILKFSRYSFPGYNMGMSYTLGKDYGGVAFFGNTRSGYTSQKAYEKKFALKLNQYPNAGQIEYISKENCDDYYRFVHNLMGEPEFSIWTEIPQRRDNISVVRLNDGISVSGIDGDSAIVAYCDGTSVGRETVVNGRVAFHNVSPNSTIMVYSHNYLPYIAPLVLQNHEINQSQYVITNGFIAGSSVDNNRSSGEVVVKSGAVYEIENNLEATLSSGFSVEKGASLIISQPKDRFLNKMFGKLE